MPQLPRVPSRELRDLLYDAIEEYILHDCPVLPPVAPQETNMPATDQEAREAAASTRNPQKPEPEHDQKPAADSTRNPS